MSRSRSPVNCELRQDDFSDDEDGCAALHLASAALPFPFACDSSSLAENILDCTDSTFYFRLGPARESRPRSSRLGARGRHGEAGGLLHLRSISRETMSTSHNRNPSGDTTAEHSTLAGTKEGHVSAEGSCGSRPSPPRSRSTKEPNSGDTVAMGSTAPRRLPSLGAPVRFPLLRTTAVPPPWT